MEIDVVGTGNNLFGFMFGNVDEAGDLDVDYLDDDAKDHLTALAENLCSSLTDFSHTLAVVDSIHQDYDDYDHENKAEDDVHYEDIDEQYVEIPEISLDDLGKKTSCFDQENYDEDEQEDLQEPLNDQKNRGKSPLPVLYMEDGTSVLCFSQIFGNHEPMKKREKRSRQNSSHYKERENKSFDAASDTVEEDDDEAFLRGPCQYSSSFTTNETSANYDEESQIFDVWKGINTNTTAKDAEQRKPAESVSVDLASKWDSPSCPLFCPLEQQDWENDIIWGNSSDGSSESCITSPVESEACYPIVVESFGSRVFSDNANILEKKHPQQLRLESCLKVDVSSYSDRMMEKGTKLFSKGSVMKKFSKFFSQNMLEDSWVDKIIWDSNEAPALNTKLIIDLQDEHMLFEIPESKDVRHLPAHATAVIIEHSVKPQGGDSFTLAGQFESSNEFNLSNDKYYSNSTATQQLKSHCKTRTGNSGPDSFAGDLENLLAAKECEMDEVGNYESKHNEKNAIEGLEMRRHPPARKPVVCGTCGQMGHIRTNKSCPRYRDQDSVVQVKCIDGPGKRNIIDPSTNLLQKTSTSIALVKTSENFEKAGSKTEFLPLKLNCGKEVAFDAESAGPPSVKKISRIVSSNKLKVGDVHVKPLKLIIKPLAEVERDQPRKKIIIKPPRGDATTVEKVKQESKRLTEEVGMKVKGSSKNDRRLPGRDHCAKRQSVVELGTYDAEYAPQRKRSRGGALDILPICPITII